MVLKKPYAFLIKYFRVIHIIITLLLAFIAYKYSKIVTFFNAYVNNGYKTSIILNLGNSYTPFYLYALVLLVIVLTILIIILLNHKKKPFKLYLFMAIYFIILFLGLFYLTSIFNSFSETLLEAKLSRSIRDITIIYFIPQFIFILFTALRAIGFNIKKLNFNDDLKEINYSHDDSEEFEVNVNFDSNRLKKKTHKTFRELLYYYKENKLIICIVLCVISIIVGYFIITNTHSNYDKKYKTGDMFTFNNVTYIIKDSLITNTDYEGNIIDEDYYFLIINLYAKNTSGKNVHIDYNSFKLYLGNNVYTPHNSYIKKFIDFSNSSIPMSLSNNTEKEYGIVYKILKSDISKSKTLELYNGSAYDKGEYISKKIFIKIKPQKLIGQELEGNYKLNDEIILNKTFLKNTKLTISNYYITDKYLYTYSSCKNDICKDYQDLITLPADSSNDKLLILDIKYDQDLDTIYSTNYQSLSSFIDNFISIQFKVGDNVITGKGENVTPQNNNNVMAIKAPREIENADIIQLIIKIRDKKYIVNLKS